MFTRIKRAIQIFKKKTKPELTKVILIISEEHIEKIFKLASNEDKTLFERYLFWKYIKDNILKTDYKEDVVYTFNSDQMLKPCITYYREG